MTRCWPATSHSRYTWVASTSNLFCKCFASWRRWHSRASIIIDIAVFSIQRGIGWRILSAGSSRHLLASKLSTNTSRCPVALVPGRIFYIGAGSLCFQIRATNQTQRFARSPVPQTILVVQLLPSQWKSWTVILSFEWIACLSRTDQACGIPNTTEFGIFRAGICIQVPWASIILV